MADVAVPFTLTTPAVTLVFNDDSADQYYITEIAGLGVPPIRAPIDNVPLGDGGLVHDFWKGPRHIAVEGVLLIQSTRIQDDIVDIRNQMEDDLIDALESILRADGTLAYTPTGASARSWTVRHDIPLDFRHVENYLLESFSFGLVAAEPDWAGSS
jgi:hypothetical protein